MKRIGSLFSGAGGLDIAVESVLGGRTVWHCEQDVAASKVLAARWPCVPNLGDITAADWSDVEPVDVLCGGFPCQDVSAAGRRAGIADGTRSGLWHYFAEAIDALHPPIVIIENVRGLLSAKAIRVSAMESHKRERVFIVAHPARYGRDEGRTESARVVGGSDAAVSGDGPLNLLPTPTSRDGKGAHQRGDDTCLHGALLPTPSVADGGGGHLTRSGARSNELLLPGVARAYAIGDLLPSPATADADRGPDFARASRDGSGGDDLVTICARATRQIDGCTWGKYEPAIRRWESLTRPTPSPTEPNTKGNPRLSAAFSEWMMGWPAGWVTEVDGIIRNDALRIIGNGVVPQQAAATISYLLNVAAVA